MSSVSTLKGISGGTACVGCKKKGLLTPVYNHGTRGRKTLYCEECKKERFHESVRRSKIRQKEREARKALLSRSTEVNV